MQPRSYQGMLEISHFTFAMGMLLLTLTHLMLFVPLASEYKPFLIAWSFLSAICDEGSQLVGAFRPSTLRLFQDRELSFPRDEPGGFNGAEPVVSL